MADNIVWTEKYRPQNFDEIIGQESIIAKIRSFVKSRNMPHLIFAGPPGSGKTTTALVIAKVLFGDDWKDQILELNASDERGIDVVRNKVKDFARILKSPNHPFKIIYLDESDALTPQAQQALRRTMEKYSDSTRFILSCNYLSKIIDPIQSRCAVFKFRRLSKDAIMTLIDSIVAKEKLKVDAKAKEALYEISNGDCRKVENILQSASYFGEITEENIYEMAAFARPKEIKDILMAALSEKNYFKSLSALDYVVKRYGLSGIDLISQFQSVVANLDIADELKIKLYDETAVTEANLVSGCDENIQLKGLIARLIK